MLPLHLGGVRRWHRYSCEFHAFCVCSSERTPSMLVARMPYNRSLLCREFHFSF